MRCRIFKILSEIGLQIKRRVNVSKRYTNLFTFVKNKLVLVINIGHFLSRRFRITKKHGYDRKC